MKLIITINVVSGRSTGRDLVEIVQSRGLQEQIFAIEAGERYSIRDGQGKHAGYIELTADKVSIQKQNPEGATSQQSDDEDD